MQESDGNRTGRNATIAGPMTPPDYEGFVRDVRSDNFTEEDLRDRHPRIFARHRKAVTEFLNVREKAPTRHECRCEVFYGPETEAKIEEIRQREPELYELPVRRSKRAKPCWDGYHGQEAVLIVNPRKWLDRHPLRQWLDWTPQYVPLRGRRRMALRAVRFYIVADTPPEKWYPEMEKFGHRIDSVERCE